MDLYIFLRLIELENFQGRVEERPKEVSILDFCLLLQLLFVLRNALRF